MPVRRLQPVAPVTQEDDRGMMCRLAVRAAERNAQIPDQLLSAIARVESGRRIASSGEMHPWPWTINAEGRGYFYETKAEAVAAVRAMQASGVRSIDVGCMQINLLHHATAFESLESAFDPETNARYAARFLTELHNSTGDWNRAAGHYHSRTPERSLNYMNAVLSVWPGEKRLADAVTRAEQLAGPRRYSIASLPAPSAHTVSLPGGASMSIEPRRPVYAALARGLAAYRQAPILTMARAPAPVQQAQSATPRPTPAPRGLFSFQTTGPLISGLPVRN